MTVKFYKVGNGLFVEIEANGILSVYDCGSTNKTTVEAAVNGFGTNRTIHNLFISHYDKDHVNGIGMLLTSNTVHHVILPMIPNLTRTLNYASSFGDYYYADLILNPVQFVRDFSRNPQTSVIQVESTNGENEENENNNPNFGNQKIKETLEKGGTLPNGADLGFNGLSLIPYNRRFMTDIELNGFLKKLGLNINSTTHEIIKTLRRKNVNLKTALASVFSSNEMNRINDYSMTLLCNQNDEANGQSCLLTGDYNAKCYIEGLKQFYRPYWNDIKFVQIPHHGSIHSSHNDICINGATHVISAKEPPYNSTMHVNPEEVIRLIGQAHHIVKDTRYNSVTL